MAGYVSVNRLSLVQLYTEERKHRAHIKKISEMQRRSGIDNSSPTHFPHLKQGFVHQMAEKKKDIAKENDAKSKKLLDIMASKSVHPPPPFQLTHSKTRRPSDHLSQSNADYLERISKAKGSYNLRDWKKGFNEHQEHLKISKDNKLFTPRDIGVNRQRIKTLSTINSRRTTPASSVVNDD